MDRLKLYRTKFKNLHLRKQWIYAWFYHANATIAMVHSAEKLFLIGQATWLSLAKLDYDLEPLFREQTQKLQKVS